VAEHLLPAALGLLSRPSVAVCSLAALVATALVRPRAGRASGRGSYGASATTTVRVLAAVGVALVGGWLLVGAATFLFRPPEFFDMATWDLPLISSWIQTGTIWGAVEFVPLHWHGSYPHNGDLVLLAGVLPWRQTFLVRPLADLYLVLAGVAVFALARELGAARGLGALFGAVAVAVPAAAQSAVGYAMPDAILFFCFAAGVLFLVRQSRTGERSDLVLAGLGLGLAFGTKWYGPPYVAIAVCVWVAGRLSSGAEVRRLAGQAGALLAMILGAGGFWLVRNVVVYGSPLHPAGVRLGPLELFAGTPNPLGDRYGHSLAEFTGRPAVWRDVIWPAFRISFGAPGLLLVAALPVALAVGARSLRRGVAEPSRALLAVAAGGGLLLACYLALPYSGLGFREGVPDNLRANARYAVPGLMVAAAVAAAAGSARPRAAPWLALLALAAVADAVRGDILHVSGAATAAVTAALGLCGGIAWATTRLAGPRPAGLGPPWPRPPRFALAAGTAFALAAVVAGGYLAQRRFDREAAYASHDPVLAWMDENAGAGMRVGLAGAWDGVGLQPVQAAFGRRLGNRVAFVAEGPATRPRAPGDAPAWVAAVRRGRYDLVLVGTGARVPGRTADPRWPAATGWTPVAASSRLTAYRVPPLLLSG
jgi:hypothetical protein